MFDSEFCPLAVKYKDLAVKYKKKNIYMFHLCNYFFGGKYALYCSNIFSKFHLFVNYKIASLKQL